MIVAQTTADASGRYDFGLSAAQEARARKLHRESIVVDLLSQNAGGNIFRHFPPALQAEFRLSIGAAGTAREAYREAEYWPFEMSRQGKSDLLRQWFEISGLTCGTYGIGVHDGRDPLCEKLEVITSRYADLPWLRYVTSAAQIRQAKRDGVVAFYAHWQPALPIPRDLTAIDVAYAKGLRSLMLTYNLMDNVGVGCTERVDAGLSTFGLDVVKHCNNLGMIVDVSHCGPLTTLDACRYSKQPVNANHTAAKGVYCHARGKSDEALHAIAGSGGVVGVVALPAFLTADPEATIEHMLDHIDYIAELVGWQHVAIGTDWPLQAPEDLQRAVLSHKSLGFRDEDRLDVTKRLVGYDDCRDLPNITRGLVKRGYSDEQIQGVLGENALRVFAEVCDRR
jgi:membrane dipeptidase